MATFLLIEINCDHLEDLRRYDVGVVVREVARNPANAARILDDNDLYRAVRIVGQTGVRTYAEDVKKIWLWKPE